MYSKLVIEGNSVYEIYEECMKLRRRGRRGSAGREEHSVSGAPGGAETVEKENGKIG